MGYHLTTPVCASDRTSITAYPRFTRYEAGLRFLTTSQGRWLSRDPITEPGSAAQDHLVDLVRQLVDNDWGTDPLHAEYLRSATLVAPDVVRGLLLTCPRFAAALSGHGAYSFCLGQPTTRTDNDGAFSILEVLVAGAVILGVAVIAAEIVRNQRAAKEDKDDLFNGRYMVGECKRINKEIVIGAMNGPPIVGPLGDSLKELATEELIKEGEKRAAEGFWEWLFSDRAQKQSPSRSVDYGLHPL